MHRGANRRCHPHTAFWIRRQFKHTSPLFISGWRLLHHRRGTSIPAGTCTHHRTAAHTAPMATNDARNHWSM